MLITRMVLAVITSSRMDSQYVVSVLNLIIVLVANLLWFVPSDSH